MRFNSFKFLAVLALTLLFTLQIYSQNDDNCPDVEGKKELKLYNQAFDYFRDRKFNEASQLFRQVLEMDSACGKCYFFLGMINFKRVDYNLKAAKRYFEQSIALCPEFDIYVYYYLGDIYYGAEDWKMAEKYLSIFLKDPEKIDSEKDQTRAEAMLKYAIINNQLLNNPVPFNPQCVKGVSSVSDEYIPSISPDGENLYYVRVIQMPPNKNDLIKKTVFKEKFYFSKKNGEIYSNGEEMPYPFNVFPNEGGASLTIDNNELYYSVCRDKGTYLNCDIYYTRKDESGLWNDIEPVPVVNNDDTWESMPCISADGSTLYFVSDRAGGLGGYDIYYSRKDVKGVWGTPVNMGKNINTPFNEKTPFMHSDGQTFYFSSDSPNLGGLGNYDIYFTRLQPDGGWGKPVNIGYPINSESVDDGFFVSLDGKTGYFTSNKYNGVGGWDIYAFELYKEARPEEMRILKGNIKEENTEKPVNAKIEIKNVETKKVKQIPVDSISGNYSMVINTRNNYILTVKKPDYAYESKLIASEGDTLTNIIASRKTVKEIDFKIKPITIGTSYRLNDIYFATGEFELNIETKAILDGFIEFLNENIKIKVAIHGHTDNIGNDDNNMILSENRSKSVYNYLIENKVKPERLSYKGFGETKPVASNDTEQGRAKNRRTEFVILEK